MICKLRRPLFSISTRRSLSQPHHVTGGKLILRNWSLLLCGVRSSGCIFAGRSRWIHSSWSHYFELSLVFLSFNRKKDSMWGHFIEMYRMIETWVIFCDCPDRSNWNFLHIVCLYVLETLQTGVGTYLSFVLEILMPLKRCLRKQS